MRPFLSFFLLFLFHFSLVSAMGEWNIYNATPSTTRLQYHAGRLYTITGHSLCSYSTDPNDDDYQQLNRATGLSGTDVQFILSVPASDCLAIVYADGDLDLMDSDGSIRNIPDLANKALAGDKTIYSILASGHHLFVSGGFGFMMIDTRECYIQQTYHTSFAVNLAFQHGDYLYRYSSKYGLQYGSIADNLSDSRHWHKFSSSLSIKQALCFTAADSLQHCWLIDDGGILWELNDHQQVTRLSDRRFSTMYPMEDRVWLTTNSNELFIADPHTLTFTPNLDDPFFRGTEFTSIDHEGHFFMLLNESIIYRCEITEMRIGERAFFNCEWDNTISPDGISTYYLGALYTTANGWTGISRRSYISGYAAAHALSGALVHYDAESDAFTNVTPNDIVRSLPDRLQFQGLTGLAIDPQHDERYAISTGMHGIYIIDHDTLFQRLDERNTQGGIEAFGADFLSTRTSAVAYDDEGTLFFTNSMQDTVLRCMLPDGTFRKFPNPGFSQQSDATRILLARHDNIGLKWVLNDYGYQKSRIGLYYDKESYQTAWFSTLVDQDLNEYVPNYIYGLCEDLTGKVWVLTSLGPFVVEDPISTFNYAQQNPGKGRVRRIKIPRNDGTNLADYLMESTDCVCMAIDNFNRKWIGTRSSGLYLMSADCITTLEHFTMDNSPLVSDGILALAYDQESGLLYISCEGGVLSYQTDAIEGEADFSGIYCYPNPVRPEYSGELRIMGLMNDSQVSISTTSGELVFRTQSQGATTTWDLRTASGSRVEPGIYMIHGVDSEGKKGGICKFLVL